MRKGFLFVAISSVAVGTGSLLLDGTGEEAQAVDPDNLTPDQEKYCEKVEKWRMEVMLDVDPKWRLGHPDDKGTYTAWCLGDRG